MFIVIILTGLSIYWQIYKQNDTLLAEEQVEQKTEEEDWWSLYKRAVVTDYSKYPSFYRGVWAPRVDVMRQYAIHADELRAAGVDSIMMEVEAIFDQATGEVTSLTDDLFVFYIQTFKKQGFRVFIVLNPMHPNMALGQGFDWDGNDPSAKYRGSRETINMFTSSILKWAALSEMYGVEGFLPILEPHVLAGNVEVASIWLQEILPLIRENYSRKVGVIDIMYGTGQGRTVIPYPYDYTGYDFIIGGIPAGRKPKILSDWVDDVSYYVNKGVEYVNTYEVDGFGLYEWGGYTGGVWYEDVQMCIYDQCLTQEEAKMVEERGISLLENKESIILNFSLVGTGWTDFGMESLSLLSDWYLRIAEYNALPFEECSWTYEELINIERELGGDDYEKLCTLDEWSICTEMNQSMSDD